MEIDQLDDSELQEALALLRVLKEFERHFSNALGEALERTTEAVEVQDTEVSAMLEVTESFNGATFVRSSLTGEVKIVLPVGVTRRWERLISPGPFPVEHSVLSSAYKRPKDEN